LTLGLGVGGYIPVLAFTCGIRDSRLAVVAPIAATAPLITVLLSFGFLGVVIDPIQWIAIAMVVVSNVLVSVDLANWRQSNLLRLSSGVPFAIVAAIGWGVFYFFLVPSTRVLGPWMSAFVAEVGVTIAAGVHLWVSHGRIVMGEALRPGVIGNGLLQCIGIVAFTVGVAHFNVGLVAALSNSTALVTSSLGVLMFKERLHVREKVAAGGMIAGVALVSMVR
jgi:drug/metabolite transporter (DMT)-like permease